MKLSTLTLPSPKTLLACLMSASLLMPTVQAAPSTDLPSEQELQAWTKSLNQMAKKERDPLLASLLFDQFEIVNSDDNPISWEMTGWLGTDQHKVYLNSEGEQIEGETESENQLLYSRPLSPFWDLQAGIGMDIMANKSNSWAIIGLQGLAPYFFEVNAQLLANDETFGIRLEAEYEALFTQKLILTPQIKINAYGADQMQYGIGSGLSSTEMGLRLRYEITRKFAPYIGIKRHKLFGKTADIAADGEDEEISAVIGLRFWF